jgi:N-acetyl-anhydromuramyl-L-alanine amidase AmpD
MDALAIGARGPDVTALQAALAEAGYSVGVVDGIFGPRTHNAVLALQARFGLPATGIAGEIEWAALRAGKAVPPPLPPVLASTLPYVEAKHFNRAIKRQGIYGVVLHCMESPESSTRAEHCAQYMATLPDTEPKKSAHYYADSDSVVQGVRDDRIAYHAPGCNEHWIGIEHAGYARQSRDEWLDAFGQRMLSLSAQLTARKAREHGFPLEFVDAAGLLAGKHGITTHAEVTRAFHRSTHLDPGPEFPIDWYLTRARVALAKAVA